MTDQLFDALETCLTALENGETMDSALARFPHLQVELRPILETSLQARTLAVSSIPSEAQRRGRARLLQRSAEMREAKRTPRRTWLYNFRPIAVALMLALFFLTGTGLVRASSGALPGDNLYPVKRSWEDMQLFFAFDSNHRENLEVAHENERLTEIDELIAKGRSEIVTFSGRITAQANGQWTVAGIPVRISDQTRLPDQLVSIGAGVTVTGQTDAQGFLLAHSVEILPAGAILPSKEHDSHDGHDGANATLTATPSPGETEVETPSPGETPSVTETETVTPKETETPHGNGGENGGDHGGEHEGGGGESEP